MITVDVTAVDRLEVRTLTEGRASTELVPLDDLEDRAERDRERGEEFHVCSEAERRTGRLREAST